METTTTSTTLLTDAARTLETEIRLQERALSELFRRRDLIRSILPTPEQGNGTTGRTVPTVTNQPVLRPTGSRPAKNPYATNPRAFVSGRMWDYLHEKQAPATVRELVKHLRADKTLKFSGLALDVGLHKSHRNNGPFVKMAPGLWGLRGWKK